MLHTSKWTRRIGFTIIIVALFIGFQDGGKIYGSMQNIQNCLLYWWCHMRALYEGTFCFNAGTNWLLYIFSYLFADVVLASYPGCSLIKNKNKLQTAWLGTRLMWYKHTSEIHSRSFYLGLHTHTQVDRTLALFPGPAHLSIFCSCMRQPLE